MSAYPIVVTQILYEAWYTEDLRAALLGIDEELRRLHGAPHQVEDHGLAHAWVKVRAALWPAGSRAK